MELPRPHTITRLTKCMSYFSLYSGHYILFLRFSVFSLQIYSVHEQTRQVNMAAATEGNRGNPISDHHSSQPARGEESRAAQLQQRVRELSAISDLPPIDVEDFNKYINRQKNALKQKRREHDGWRRSFEKKKQRVMVRISDYTTRRRRRIHHLEKIVEETYERYVHNRNTTDHEKSVERVILSREASRDRIAGPAATIYGEALPTAAIIVEEDQERELA